MSQGTELGTFGHASMDLPQWAQIFYDNSGMLLVTPESGISIGILLLAVGGTWEELGGTDKPYPN